MDIPAFPLQIFYDGSCSVCAAEMGIYQRKEHGGRLIFVDVSSPDFDPALYGIALNAFMHEMHAIDRRGRVYRGVEAFWAIWHAFPTSSWYGFLGNLVALPGASLLARLAYSGFARTRKYLPKRRCDDGVCRLNEHKPPP
jgi:predicted DCC family thiol-disulfide oxidoreductase YuxK